MPRRYRLFMVLAVVVLALDQLTKWWARAALAQHGYAGVPFIDGYWHWRLSFNTGSAFGLFSKLGGARVVLSVIGLAACGAIVHYLRKAGDDMRAFVSALALVFAGALGNVIDRVFAGKVTDFILWKYQTHEWPVFNVADVALVVGVGILFLTGAKAEKKAQEEAREERRRG